MKMKRLVFSLIKKIKTKTVSESAEQTPKTWKKRWIFLSLYSEVAKMLFRISISVWRLTLEAVSLLS